MERFCPSKLISAAGKRAVMVFSRAEMKAWMGDGIWICFDLITIVHHLYLYNNCYCCFNVDNFSNKYVLIPSLMESAVIVSINLS